MIIRERLFELKDEKYADFQSRLTPGVPRENFIGVRVPKARKLAKKLMKENQEAVTDFLKELPHEYFDENVLHGMLVSEIKDYETCVEQTEIFLPYVDNWAVCDTMSPKVFKKNKDRLLDKIYEWSSSDHVYTCRFGIGMLMRYFLDEDFKPEYLQLPASIRSEEYYVNMMVAWFFATALAKQWDESIVYLTENRLDTWVHNKTIQKARESYRITKDQKAFLKTIKR